jgi:RNA polymerase sigma factor (TIGR02999 family)
VLLVVSLAVIFGLMSEVSSILNAMKKDDPEAVSKLMPLVYAELRRLAKQRLARERPGQTLDATALVHEAYLRVVGDAEPRQWDGRGHFFAAAAEAMRRILVERARRKSRQKHGGGRKRQALHPDLVAVSAPDEELIALDAALDKLAHCHPEKARLVELRYFGGLSGDEAARLLGISPSSADRHWVFARAWLRRQMQDGAAADEKNKKT